MIRYASIFTIVILTAISGKLCSQQWNGLTIYSNQGSTLCYLLDTNSVAVKTWTFSGNTGYSTHMMPGGFIYRAVTNPGNILTGGGITGRVQKLDYSGTLLWEYVYSTANYVLHHDICPMANGNVLVISYDVMSPSTATAAGASTAITVWSEKIMELKPVGTNSAIVVWEWKVSDHLVQDFDPSLPNYDPSIVDNPQLLNINYNLKKDWMHMNGIDYNPVLDQIALSSHNLNEWYIIDHSTTTAEAASHSGGNAGKGGDFLYRWGNPAAYGATGNTILNVTHDAHWVPENCPNAGYLAGINNKGQITPSTKTTADQVVTPRNGYNYSITPGSAFAPASFSARNITSGYTSNMGSTEQYPNGNQLICLATVGSIFEIGPTGTVLWSKNTGGVVSQSHRYTECYINNLPPPQPSITVAGDTLKTATAASYQWYCNGTAIPTGTAMQIIPSLSGIYVVKTTDANGCVYMYSKGQSFTVTTPPPPPVSVKDIGKKIELSVFPNPADNELFIDAGVNDYDVTVTDILGRIAAQYSNADRIDLSGLKEGLYFVTVCSGDSSATRKINVVR